MPRRATRRAVASGAADAAADPPPKQVSDKLQRSARKRTARKAAVNKGGRPPHEPTAQTRLQVRRLAGLGLPQAQIALLLGISPNTLVKHYEHELRLGDAEATEKVAATLYRRATRDGDLGAAIFWLKARAGWREKLPDQQVKHSGRVEHEHAGEVGVRLTDEQRAAVLAAVRARAVEEAGADGGGLAGAD